METASIDDAQDVLDPLITSNLPARAERAGKVEQLRSLPRLRSAARRGRLGGGDLDGHAAGH